MERLKKSIMMVPLCLGVVIISILSVLLYLLTLPFKLLVVAIARLFRPDLGALITNETQFFLYQTENINIVSYFWVLGGQLGLNQLTESFQQRILQAKNPDGTFLFHRLREYHSEFLGYDFWRSDTNFRVSNHIKEVDITLNKNLESLSTFEEKLEKLTSDVATTSIWKRNQSPWEILLVNFPRENRTVLITRFQHTLADGYSILFLLEHLFQCTFKNQPKTSPSTRIWDFSWSYLFWYPLRMVWDTAEVSYMLANERTTAWHRKDLDNFKFFVAYSKPIEVDDIKRIRKKFEVEYNTVVFAAISRAFYRVMREAHQELPPYITLCFIGPKCNHPKITTNHMYGHIIPLSSTENSIQALNQNVSKTKQTLAHFWLDFFMVKSLFNMPVLLKRFIVPLRKDCTIAISNFVTCDAAEFDGFRILDAISFIGGQPCKTGIVIYVSGTFDKVRISVMMSKEVAPDADSASKLANYAFDEVQSMIGEMK